MDFIIGMLIGAALSFFYWRSIILSAIEQALLTPSKEFQDKLDNIHVEQTNILQVMVEQEGDQFLLYRQDTNNFVMQGSCLQDFQQRMKSMKFEELSIINGGSDAAKALVAISENKKEHSENSNNQ